MKQTTGELRVHNLDAARQWADDRDLFLIVISAETKTVRLESGIEGFPEYTNREHVMSQAEVPRCIYCGCDEDEVFTGNELCIDEPFSAVVFESIANGGTPQSIADGIKDIK